MTQELAFNKLHPSLQEKLYKMRWTSLRQIQVDTINTVFNTDSHIVIAAATASGKTEAAFLPTLSKILELNELGCGILYIGPLKALINDQFRRLEELCQLADIPVFKWHGDVSASEKKKFLKRPQGVLLITPESVESLFINHPNDVGNIFRNLQFVVIDELHTFLDCERGIHLRSLLCRVAERVEKVFRIIGLSATIRGDEAIAEWISPDSKQDVKFIRDADSASKEIRFLLKGYGGESTDMAKSEDKLVSDILLLFQGRTSLIFVNSRENVEYYADKCKRHLHYLGVDNIIYVHHGSLSKSEREETENKLKTSKNIITFCSSSLELGIDVGNISLIGQIGAPWSVASLLQRLGRSGRNEDEPSSMVMFINEQQQDEPDLVDLIYPDLLKGIAMSQLAISETPWVEMPDTSLLHFSTMVQQIMSIITEKGGDSALHLYNQLVISGPFRGASMGDFAAILHTMGKMDVIEQTPEGALILGLLGEKIVKNYDFYSAFLSDKEYKVYHKDYQIGSIAFSPNMLADRYLILSAKRWNIIDIDDEREIISVVPAQGGRAPKFISDGGAETAAEIRVAMHNVLKGSNMPVFLDSRAKVLLSQARKFWNDCNPFDNDLLETTNGSLWFTWTSSQKHRTLMLLGKFFGHVEVEDREGIALFFNNKTKEDIKHIYNQILKDPPSLTEITKQLPVIRKEKYDNFVPDYLLMHSFAKKYLDNSFPPSFTWK